MISPSFEILNQKGTPMFNSDLTANRPVAGVVGRIFIATDSPYGIFRDNGSTWDQVASGGGGASVTGSGTATRVAFWDSASSISSNANLYWDNTNNRLGIGTATPGVPLDIHGTGTNASFNGTGTNNALLVFQNAGTGKWQIGNVYSAGSNYFRIFDVLNTNERLTIQNNGLFSFAGYSYLTDTRTYSTGTIQSATFDKQLTIPNAATISASSTISSTLIGGTTTFQGSVTIPNSTTLSTNLITNNFSFSSIGTITMTQATGIRVASSNQVLSYFSGTASSTITHYAASSIYGFFNVNTGTITPVITNAYMHLINDMNDYTHTFTFTNRWGIYQAGASDNNYFAAKVLIGTNVVSTYQLDVTGNARVSGAMFQTTATNNINLLLSTASSQAADRGILIGSATTYNAASVVALAIGNSTIIGTGTGNIAIGYQAQATAGSLAIANGAGGANSSNGGIALGSAVTVNGGIGIKANAFDSGCIAMSTNAQATNSIAIGNSGTSNGNYSIVIGDRASVTHSSSIVLGLFARSTAANQLVIGSSDSLTNGQITDVYFGSGVQRDGTNNGAGVNYTINGSGGLGTNQNGGNLTIAAGKGTGTGAGGVLIFSTPTVGVSGTTLQSLTERARIDVNVFQLSDGMNIVLNTTTGTKIGTATTQKIGFWNVSPIVQPTTAVAAATFVANTGTAVNNASTFDGYTIQQVVKALRNIGLLA